MLRLTARAAPAVEPVARLAVAAGERAGREDLRAAAELAARLHLPLHRGEGVALLLVVEGGRLALHEPAARTRLVLDFTPAARRRYLAHAGRDPLIRALGRRGRRVVDATAGLGGDCVHLAWIGERVVAIERHPVVAALLADALARAQAAGVLEPGSIEPRGRRGHGASRHASTAAGSRVPRPHVPPETSRVGRRPQGDAAAAAAHRRQRGRRKPLRSRARPPPSASSSSDRITRRRSFRSPRSRTAASSCATTSIAPRARHERERTRNAARARALLYVPTLADGTRLTLTGDEAHHAAAAQRLREGDRLALFDGRGNVARGWLRAVRARGREIEIEVEERLALPRRGRARCSTPRFPKGNASASCSTWRRSSA